MSRLDLQAQGERELRDKLLADREIRQAIERVDKEADKYAVRRQLLATATPSCANRQPTGNRC